MMKIITVLVVIVGVFCEFSPELTEKYSIQILKSGEQGTQPHTGDRVKMHYDGKLKDGTKFDSSYDRGDPLQIQIGRGQVIKCWDEVGLHMNVNSKVRVLCPSSTAYGSRSVGPIPGNSDLVFIIERVK